ncbi:MAG: DEAD/DEAH box helicase family protein [Anaerolineales bacterium]|nr:DEAD/DEAH box helicase family protein [Anaerolineales bacterium]
MQIKFDSSQEFQIQAVEAVANLFDGQPRLRTDVQFTFGFAAIPNRLDLSDAELLANLNKVQNENGIEPDREFMPIERVIETIEGKERVNFHNFSVEMETGTGKTYVYLRTAFELFRRYGFRKFIIVVPSVAVREGVLKTLEITQKHLRELYDNTPCRYYAYDSANLSQVRQFALSESVELMVMTIDSFNKSTNVINQTTDRLQGETPIHLVQAARPILILDEPQNMESELRVAALAALNPLFALRYSATHRNPYNLVYRLTPYEAYRQGLVKRVEVAGVEKESDENQAFLRLDEVNSEKKTLTARIAVHALLKNGTVKEKIITVKPGDTLEKKANRPDYAGFVVEEISVGNQSVLFQNNAELRVGESRGADKKAVFEAQIRYTVQEHFRKQKRLRERGIKVLSLFFIDRVDNYANEDGLIRVLFNKAFNELKSNTEFSEIESDKVQAAYFASRRTKTGEIVYEDSKTGESERDKETYDLIMKDKERLMSFEEPTCFIFSHSALREGWDSPNVFQICTLNQTTSEMKKRQEIGRGVRLAINQQGERVRDEQVNILTVIANESYESYVGKYQSELEAEYGAGNLPPNPPSARKQKTARLRKGFELKPEFKELWERIKHKTRYNVTIDSQKLIADTVKELNEETIRPPQIVVRRARLEAKDKFFTAIQTAERPMGEGYETMSLPNITELVSAVLERTSPTIRLTRITLLEIYKQCANTIQQAALKNPFEFASIASRIIKNKLADQLVEGIQYEKINEYYEMTQFVDLPNWEDSLIPSPHSIYEHVIYDSEVEKRFVADLEKREDVKLYVKLPSWFTVPTPIGEYNPDWAIVLEKKNEDGEVEDVLYLVRETKDTRDLDKLRHAERRKIIAGKQHFNKTLGVNYSVVVSARELGE